MAYSMDLSSHLDAPEEARAAETLKTSFSLRCRNYPPGSPADGADTNPEPRVFCAL